MRRTSLWILALSLVVGACDSGPSIATLDQMRVVKVSGDQASQVPSAPSATIYATAGASLSLLDGDGYTPEPLVARVEVDGAQSRGIMSGGATIPVGTLIHWDLPAVAGKIRGLTTATDDSAHIVNRWAPGIRAGTYTASAHRILADGTITDDAEWELVVEPGPIASFNLLSGFPANPYWRWPPGRRDPYLEAQDGDTLDLRLVVATAWDQYGNSMPHDTVRVRAAATWTVHHTHTDIPEPQGQGWLMPTPPVGTHHLFIWLDGRGRQSIDLVVVPRD